MREDYHHELRRYVEGLAILARSAEQAMRSATTALLEADSEAAEEVVSAVETIVVRHHELDNRALILLARQQPVATELRTCVAGLRMSVDIERMGVLASHVAELTVRHGGHPVVPVHLRPTVTAMGEVAHNLAVEAWQIIEDTDVDRALELDIEDDKMDRLQESLVRGLMDGSERTDIATAVDLTLLGRYYERFADHAVSLAKRISFVAAPRSAARTS